MEEHDPGHVGYIKERIVNLDRKFLAAKKIIDLPDGFKHMSILSIDIVPSASASLDFGSDGHLQRASNEFKNLLKQIDQTLRDSGSQLHLKGGPLQC